MTRAGFKTSIKKTIGRFKKQLLAQMEQNQGRLALVRVDTSMNQTDKRVPGFKKEQSDGLGFGIRRFKLTSKKYMKKKITQLVNDMIKAYSVYLFSGTADIGFINSLSVEFSNAP